MKIPFSFTAIEDNQVLFGPISIPEIIGFVSIDGELQNPVGTDFSLGGVSITLNSGVPIGTVISGVLDI